MSKPARIRSGQVQKWIWPLIYVGLALLALGLSIRPMDRAFGWTVAAPGIAAVIAGLVLIWIRSRMAETKEKV
ncbi:MAG: hypothetical protein M3O01_05000 [Pseudomonadota bacterium]|nr:hypothetical protein [Pseudomonadota bacterium]